MLDKILLKTKEIFVGYSLSAIFAVLLFIFGWIFSRWLGKRTASFLEKTKLNQIIRRLGTEEALTKVDMRLNAPMLIGSLVRWCAFIFFLFLCSLVIGLNQVSQLLLVVISYFPNIFVAVIIFIVAVFLADLAQKIVVGSFEKEKVTYSRFLGRGISWGIWLLAILAILYQLEIVQTLILIIFIGVVAIIAITAGVAFGMGGKDLAAKILKELGEKFK